ncbi:glycosyl hydrolase family 18 protein [Actinoallomurus spadix]|uniref:GH18 domain-containing protein n=1 Tax=Actinoallomurus spadix TaxID=79912 RepID=A0ABP3FEM7_9ACTN|nr:glycosyl hydrolase family 18 protein [Actinoallomurus spadix]MCO5990085.1 glycosyl hydrolase family 18 protein [Actinoallomurus spadix]
MLRHPRFTTLVAVASTATALTACSATTGVRAGHGVSATAKAPAVRFQTWLYPGGPGEPSCTAASEYADDRVKDGSLNPEYWSVKSDGSVTLEASGDGTCNTYSPANVADLKAHSAHQYPTLSAMSTADVRALVRTKAKRTAAIEKVTSLVAEANLSGVDVDMEDYWSWSADDFAGYKAFLKELATALHAKGKRLQVDAPAMTEDASFYDYRAVKATGVDDLVIMAYDEEYDSASGKECLPIAPYDWLKKVTAYAESRVPVSDLIIGLPSYGYSAPAKCDTGKITGNVHFSEMKKKPGFATDAATVEKRRDPSSGEIRWTSNGTLYDYVDRTALDRKLQVLTSLGVTRVSVWSLGGGNPWFSR